MKQVFNVMPDKMVGLMGMAFALATERDIIRQHLVEYGVLTAEEIFVFHYAAFNKGDKSIAILRDKLNKINDLFVEAYHENTRSQL